MIDFRYKDKKGVDWFVSTLRIFLGLVFIFASLHKIADPSGFAKIIYGYGVFPEFSINLIAIVLPFIELLSGVLLCLNLWSDSALFIVCSMLASFIIIISYNMLRGHVFDCGCFSLKGDHTLPLELLIRDILLFAVGCCLFWYRMPKKNNQS